MAVESTVRKIAIIPVSHPAAQLYPITPERRPS